ncbi:hypothetical protein [Sulfurimonas sp. HSL-1716]|uniref:hypothetical protein n=1 Tax=Hydrocurvibacter sulfurireducens TaxID=3131937 RepID=UPI0031F78848
MRSLLLLISLFTLLFSDAKQDIYSLYQLKQYDKACKLGLLHFSKHRDDENFVSIYAFSCLNADYIDRLSVPITILKNSKEARSNAAYLSIILMQKKLLEHSLKDNYNIKSLKLPTTDNILSKVFDLYSNLQIHKKIPLYVFIDPNNAKITYKLYLSGNADSSNMVIEELYDSTLVKKHIYR